MEQVRLLVAVVLSFLVFLVWSMFFSGKKTDQPVEPIKKVNRQRKCRQRKRSVRPKKWWNRTKG